MQWLDAETEAARQICQANFPVQGRNRNGGFCCRHRDGSIVSGPVAAEGSSFQLKGCLVQVGNGIELETVGLQFEPYRWRHCGVTWDSSRTVVVIKLRRTSALSYVLTARLFGHVREHRHRRVDLIGV